MISINQLINPKKEFHNHRERVIHFPECVNPMSIEILENYDNLLENEITSHRVVHPQIMFEVVSSNERFSMRSISRKGRIEWAARAPDLTRVDFFLWSKWSPNLTLLWLNNTFTLMFSILIVLLMYSLFSLANSIL